MDSNDFASQRKTRLSPAVVEALALLKLKLSRDPRARRARLSALVASRLGQRAARYRARGDFELALAEYEKTEQALVRARMALAGASKP